MTKGSKAAAVHGTGMHKNSLSHDHRFATRHRRRATRAAGIPKYKARAKDEDDAGQEQRYIYSVHWKEHGPALPIILLLKPAQHGSKYTETLQTWVLTLAQLGIAGSTFAGSHSRSTWQVPSPWKLSRDSPQAAERVRKKGACRTAVSLVGQHVTGCPEPSVHEL